MLAVLYWVITFILRSVKITELVSQSRMKLCVFVGVLLDFSTRSTKSYIAMVYRFMRMLWKLMFIDFSFVHGQPHTNCICLRLIKF